MPRKKSKREVVIKLPAVGIYFAVNLCNDGTYDLVDDNGEAFYTNNFYRDKKNRICLQNGFYQNGLDQCLNERFPDIDKMIEWETVEKWIFE